MSTSLISGYSQITGLDGWRTLLVGWRTPPASVNAGTPTMMYLWSYCNAAGLHSPIICVFQDTCCFCWDFSLEIFFKFLQKPLMFWCGSWLWLLHTSATLPWTAKAKWRGRKYGGLPIMENSPLTPPLSLHAGQDELARTQKALWACHERPINHAASPRGPACRTPPPRMPLSQQVTIPACTASV